MITQRESHPDPEMERLVGVWLTDTDLAPDEAEHGLDQILDDFPTTPQARRRSLGRWLERVGAARRRSGEHDHPPDRPDRRNRLMFSLTAMTATLAVLLLATNLAPFTAQAPPETATEGTTHVVAADGSGAFTSIQAAADAAADGDTILIRPGTYTESVVIDKDISVRGDGPRDEIVLTAPEDGPTAGTGDAAQLPSALEPYAVLLADSGATVSDLTLRGERSLVHARGGQPRLERLMFDGVGITYMGGSTAGGNGVVISDGSRAVVNGNELTGGGPIGIFDGSDPVITGNRLTDGPHIWGNPGTDARISGNTIVGTLSHGMGIYGPRTVGVVIEGNTIRPERGAGISVGYSRSTGVDPLIRNNDISGGTSGIYVGGLDARPTIEGNRLTGNDNGIFIGADAPALVIGNILTANSIGLVVAADARLEGNVSSGNEFAGVLITSGSPELVGNTIEGNGTGIRIGTGGATPTLTGNVICGNGEDVMVNDGEAEPDLSGNPVC